MALDFSTSIQQLVTTKQSPCLAHDKAEGVYLSWWSVQLSKTACDDKKRHKTKTQPALKLLMWFQSAKTGTKPTTKNATASPGPAFKRVSVMSSGASVPTAPAPPLTSAATALDRPPLMASGVETGILYHEAAHAAMPITDAISTEEINFIMLQLPG